MAEKRYFVKASHISVDQPLIREHINTSVYLDLSKDARKIVEKVHDDLYGRHEQWRSEFTVDFMIESPEDD